MKRFFIYLVSILGLTVICFGLLLVGPLESVPLVGVKDDYAITGVSVVDTVNGQILPKMTVLLSQGHIVKISPTKGSDKYPGFREIAAAGKYLIPGLWDMHTHGLKLSPQIHHPLFIRYGVTAVRDMSGCLSQEDSYWACPEDRRFWQEQALKGAGVSPRYPLQSSYQTNGGNEVPDSFPTYFRIASEDDARQVIEFYRRKNVDFVKTYTELSKEQYDNLIKYASQKGIAVAGHKPIAISLTHALNTGLKSIEHGRLFVFECYQGIEDFRTLEDPISHYNAEFIRDMLNRQDEQVCTDAMALMARKSSWWVPTLTTLRMSARAQDQHFRDDERLQTIPYIIRKLLWEPDIDRAATQGYDLQGNYVHQDFYSLAEKQLYLAHRSGVPIMSGTDNIDTYVFSGASLHDELGYFVEAGLTPLQALQAATILPATFAELDGELGSVEVGKRADLVLLNSNPLEKIQNTTDIYAVFFDGQYFNSDALIALENYSINMAQSLRLNVRFLRDLFSSPLMRKQLAD